MICPKCNWDNAEGSVFCNKCGCKLADEKKEDDPEPNSNQNIDSSKNSKQTIQTTEQKNVKVKKNKTIKSLVIVVSILLVISTIGGAIVFKINSDKKAKQAAYEKYELNFATATIKILTEAYICETMCNSISVTWRNAIESSYKDFNTEIRIMQDKLKNDGSLDERQKAKDDIEKTMKQLQNPPKDYEEAYKLLIDLYGYYGQIYSQATSPQGSLLTYNQDVNQKASEFSKTYDKIKVIKPDIESKAKK